MILSSVYIYLESPPLSQGEGFFIGNMLQP